MRTLLIPLLLLTLLAPPLAAHSGGHSHGPVPSWKLVNGRHIDGSLLTRHDDWIVLEGRRGKQTAVRLDEFSETDKRQITQRFAAIESLNAPLPQIEQPTTGVDHLHVPPTVNSVELIAAAALFSLLLWRLRSQRARSLAGLAGALMALLLMSPIGVARLEEMMSPTAPESIDSTFASYKPRVKTRWDATYFYVESNGMPTAMPAMKGITAWQQQVPIPQPYTGANAWSIPLNPVIADVPVSLDTALHTGAVAIAVNGVPVFNPENNRGEFSQDIGELDAFGGHCGRADDYHYHIAPVHLTPKGPKKSPVAWALDGYKLYGYEEPDGTTATNLDQHLGHIWNGEYHYHAIDKKPYMIASMRGKVTVQNDQVMPQPRAAGVRTYLQALKGATITDLRQCDTNHFALRYEVNGKTCFVNYRWDSTGKNFVFNFVKTDSARTTFNYTRK